jgi:arginine/ornithine N-succinyltransferase beta subunit
MSGKDPSADVSNALQLLGLTSLPLTSQELARRVAARHPASKAWTAHQSAAYRTVWEALDPAAGS